MYPFLLQIDGSSGVKMHNKIFLNKPNIDRNRETMARRALRGFIHNKLIVCLLRQILIAFIGDGNCVPRLQPSSINRNYNPNIITIDLNSIGAINGYSHHQGGEVRATL